MSGGIILPGNAADKSSASQQTFTGNVSAPAYVTAGLTGATAASRYVGATASGAPTSGTFAVGDFVIDHSGAAWICTASGSPGTWDKIGGGGVTSFNSAAGAVTQSNGYGITGANSNPPTPAVSLTSIQAPNFNGAVNTTVTEITSIILTTGTWLIMTSFAAESGASANSSINAWIGTQSGTSSGELIGTAATFGANYYSYIPMSFSCIYTATGSTTIYLNAVGSASGTVIQNNGNASGGNYPTSGLLAVQIA